MFKGMPWRVIVILVSIGLIRTFLSVSGLIDLVGSYGSLIVSIVIAVAWIGLAVFMRLRQPVLVLGTAGAIYAILSTLLSAFMPHFFLGAGGEAPLSLPLLLTSGLVVSLIMNIFWGAFLGLTTQVIIRDNARSNF